MEHFLDSETSKDMIIKIIACCEPQGRNKLMNVNKKLRALTAKTNTDILLHSPLLLGKRDRAFYMIYHCDEGNVNIVRNLLQNGVSAEQDTMLQISPIGLALQNKHFEVANVLRPYNSQNKIYMNAVSPVSVAVYKGDVETVKYYCSYRICSRRKSQIKRAEDNNHFAI
jgi:hypothetical protein